MAKITKNEKAEIMENLTPAVQNETPSAVMLFDPSKYKAKAVTLPVLSLKDGDQVGVKFDGAMFKGKQITEANSKIKKEAATLANVTKLDTGEQMQLIVSAVLKSTLEENYPDLQYVGKLFAIHRIAPKQGKTYATFGVFELIEG